MSRLNLELKTRLAMAVVAAVVITAVVVTALSLFVIRRDMREELGEQQFTALKLTAAALDAGFEDRRIALRLLGEGIPDAARHNPVLMQRYIEQHMSLNAQFFNVSVAEANGNVIANYADAGQINRFSMAGRDYLNDTVKGKKGVISKPLQSKMSNRPVVLMTEPVLNTRGDVELVLVASIDLKEHNFLGQFTGVRLGKSGFIFIITGDGVVVEHPDKERILKHMDDVGGQSPANNQALKGFEGSMESPDRAGEDALYSFKRMASTNWIIGAHYLTRDAYAPIAEMQERAILASAVLTVLAGLLSWWFINRLFQPLARLHAHIQRIRQDKSLDQLPGEARNDELGDLHNAFNALMLERKNIEAELDEARVNLEEMNKTLARLALEDALTGLANRRQFERGLQEEFNRAARTGLSLAVIMIDVDYFKQYNDLYGHMAGDKVLRRLGSAIRDTNLRPEDMLARYGGEEIAVLLPGAKLEGAVMVAERIRKSIEALDIEHSASASGHLTISLGVSAVAPQRQVDNPEDVLREADEALYLAKAAGRDCIRTVDDLKRSKGQA
ncbi:GGDEF domain-containing protein [Herbaspirillum sp. LeCh32-8]|uniref:sensor domain-containing diguanylate cyclase n=1 Tax=Herbaspirillum sp. LeCh32-8 TaxID=2821356 RepID=UPI001AEB435C|nr:diguanylate cyclase [Herbaspirillum sp. LeCh32-8]MBP0598329.1 GGDEF domain-containing protein [Herbaspirillum sp. LeCh32-8]